MKTKLLPAMIGAVLAGGMAAAQADVTVFGHIDTSIVNHDADVGFVNTAKMPEDWYYNIAGDYQSDNIDDTNFKCTTCSIGFKGSEDLGNGLKAIFYLDFQYDIFNRDTTSFTDRDQWLGLAGNFGQVRWGTISTPYKSHGAMIDPLYRTAAQGRDVGLQSFLHSNAGEEGQGRATNTIRWDSPSWNGLQVAAYYTLDSTERDGNINVANPKGIEDDDPYGIGVQYNNGGILVFADYITNNGNDRDNVGGDLTAWKLGGKYTLNNFAVMGQYENIEDGFSLTGIDNGKQDGTMWTVAGSYTMGNNMLYLGYGSLSVDNLFNSLSYNSDSSDQTAYTVAGTHNLSKRTMVYAAYNHIEQDNSNFINGFLSDEISVTYCAVPAGCVNDPEQDIFAVGMKHTF
jgi:predicted porin